MTHWTHRLDQLTLEQLEELIQELGPSAPLTREHSAKVLMKALVGLPRDLALLLVSADVDHTGYSTQNGRRVAHFAIQAGLKRKDLDNLLGVVGSYGMRVLGYAMQEFDKDPTQVAKDQTIEMFLLNAEDRREGTPEDVDGKEVENEFNTAAGAVPDLELREHLRDVWGIDSPEDFEMMLQALYCIRKDNRSDWMDCSRATQNAYTKQARSLFVRAAEKRCPPIALIEWEGLEWGEQYRHEMRVRPWDKLLVWGNGDAVVLNSKGEPSRTMPTIFERETPEGDVPSERDMREMMRKAYPNFYM